MAMFADTSHRSLREALAAPFHAMGSFLMLLAEARSKIAAVEWLSRLSDADLAARGTSREAEFRRIMGVRAAI